MRYDWRMNKHAPAPPSATPVTSLIDMLHRASQLVNQRYMHSIGDDGPTPRQLAVLASVAAHDGLSQTEISDATNIDRATTAEVTGRLTRMGLLKRRRTRKDARTYAVSLTDKGVAVLNTARQTSASIETELLETLGPADRTRLLQLLGRLISNANCEAGGNSPPGSDIEQG